MLDAGTKLDPYEILSPLGARDMGKRSTVRPMPSA